MRPVNYEAFVATANAGTVLGPAVDGRFIAFATAQAEFTDAAAAGTLKLQGSNDPYTATPTNWSDIPNASIAVAAGATTATPPLAAPICYEWLRLVFVRSAGAGTINAFLHGWGY